MVTAEPPLHEALQIIILALENLAHDLTLILSLVHSKRYSQAD